VNAPVSNPGLTSKLLPEQPTAAQNKNKAARSFIPHAPDRKNFDFLESGPSVYK
jgi:hypothetical protein